MQAGSGGINRKSGELISRQLPQQRMLIGSDHMHGQVGVLHDEHTTFDKRCGNHSISMAMTLSFKHLSEAPGWRNEDDVFDAMS